MPTFIFGLPAAALAMYHTAAPANRHKIKGLLLSGVIAAAITGITQNQLNFYSYFISPLLVMAVSCHYMTGLGFMVMALLGVVIGNTDGGATGLCYFLACYKRNLYKMVVGSHCRRYLVCCLLFRL